MVAWSRFSTVLTRFSAVRPLLTPQSLQKCAGTDNLALVRKMSGDHRVMNILPTKFLWNKFKDSFHFYFMLGAIPVLSTIFLVNVFVGPAQIAEIPEGYEPKNWEYHSHPIKRWFARYVYPTHQQRYEVHLHLLHEESERIKMKRLARRVEQLMADRGDYQAWYYRPFLGKYHRKVRQSGDQFAEQYRGINIELDD